MCAKQAEKVFIESLTKTDRGEENESGLEDLSAKMASLNVASPSSYVY